MSRGAEYHCCGARSHRRCPFDVYQFTMTLDRLARIVWYGGRPYPVWSHPRGVDDPGTHWHVQTPDGEWHSVLRRRDGDMDGDGWSAVVDAVGAWLENWWADRVDIHDED